MVWYSHLFKNFPQFVVIHTVKGIISFQISVIFLLLINTHGVELLGHMVLLLLDFWRNFHTVFTVATPSPTNNVQVFSFLHILANIVSCVFLMIACFFDDRCEVISHCGFVLH